ncbi:MAG TPA: alkaline phosphatase family protein [Conexibacter sp.]|nr:alkaline phosphatase family protein [Conexibacter sp.]
MLAPAHHDAGACAQCATPLAHDQRYCVACGARRGALPGAIAALIAAGLRAGGAFPQGDALAAATDHAHEHEPSEHPFARWMPQPRAAALAVMALLAFGVVVGSIVSPPADSAGTPPVLVALAQPPTTPPPTPAVDTGGGDTRSTADVPATAAAPVAAAPAPAAPASYAAPAPPDTPPLPDVRHVFLIVLTGHGYDEAFGPGSPARYLSRELPRAGELLANYYGVAQSELANGIALISGQGPTAQTAANCPRYGDVTPGTLAADGTVSGDGCVYPSRAQTLADQLTAGGRTWRAYVEDEGAGPAAEASTCRHPPLGTADAEQAPRPGDAYVTWRNPFVYFHSLTDTPACAANDVDLGQLATDLRAPDTTPTLAYVVPDRCHDGSEQPCAPGQSAGLAAADAWLRTVVPEIEASPAYRDGGVIAITFDQAPQSGPNADAGSCCDQPAFPNLAAGSGGTAGGTGPTPTTPATTVPTVPDTPAGGGRVGLLLLSQFVRPGTVTQTERYNHFSLLRSIEDLFDLQHLGYAADPALPAFDTVVWNAASH